MLAKRIIPCLDTRDGKVVKGVKFEGVRDIGDPVLLAEEYNKQGADELVFYDITASHEKRGVVLDMVREVAKKVFIPLCVGGGIATVDDVREILRAGADKVSINSAAVKNPSLIKDTADVFGSQCVVLGVDAMKDDGSAPICADDALIGDVAKNNKLFGSRKTFSGYTIYINGARVNTGIDLIEWVKYAAELGAGEICLNSIDADGTKEGFDIDMLNAVCEAVNIPIIASGGAGKLEDFSEVFEKTNSSAALAASLFHFGELTVDEIKTHLKSKGINARKWIA